ncbi:MAG: PA0069 family radical SAM protein [Alphaproteobacteria bacterium]|nr:PA0069 family radical SAM protein [Alphaproteobacteria bacterium]
MRSRPGQTRRGRGALSNDSGRFERHTRHAFNDGWDGGWDDGAATGPAPATQLHEDASRTVIARNNSPDVGFDRSINPYRGCEHGCIYCYARPTHAFLGHSPGLDFETQIYTKPDAARALTAELAAPRYDARPIAMGTNTDPYQPIERWLKITRSILEVLAAHNHPVTITTKSAGIIRDLDILGEMAKRNLASVALSVTSLDRRLARDMEPRAAAPQRRLDAIAAAAAAGVPVSVMVAPIIPGLNDHELEAILERAADAGAVGAGYILLRLPLEVAGLFREWLEEARPDQASKVLHRLTGMRGGKLNDPGFATRMVGTGPEADLLRQRFAAACRRYGLARSPQKLETGLFVRPIAQCNFKSDQKQLALF